MSTTIDRQSIVPRSAFKYRPIAPIIEAQDVAPSKPRASRARNQQELHTTRDPIPAVTEKHRVHWLVPVVMTMLTTIVLLWLLQLAWSWAATVSDDLRYGRPRTTQIDAFVGHESSKTASHFLAINWHGRAEILEFPGGDVGKRRSTSGLSSLARMLI